MAESWEQHNRKQSFDKFVGFGAETEKDLRKFFEDFFERNIARPYIDIEEEKPPEVIAVIDDILKSLPQFVERYGGIPLRLRNDQIIFAKPENLPPRILKFIRQHNILAMFRSFTQDAICFHDPAAESKLLLAHMITHELLHFSAFQSIQKAAQEGQLKPIDEMWITSIFRNPAGAIIKTEKFAARIRRSGLSIRTKDKKIYFSNLNEAVTEELTLRFAQEYFPEIPQLQFDLGKLTRAIGEKWGEEYADRVGFGKGHDVIYMTQIRDETGQEQSVFHRASYVSERETLNFLIDDLFEKNRGGFSSREDVFKLFAGAAMSGRLLPLARLIERTYGKGSFRQIGAETSQEVIYEENERTEEGPTEPA